MAKDAYSDHSLSSLVNWRQNFIHSSRNYNWRQKTRISIIHSSRSCNCIELATKGAYFDHSLPPLVIVIVSNWRQKTHISTIQLPPLVIIIIGIELATKDTYFDHSLPFLIIIFDDKRRVHGYFLNFKHENYSDHPVFPIVIASNLDTVDIFNTLLKYILRLLLKYNENY